MSRFDQQLALPTTLVDYCEAREKIMGLVRHGLTTLDKADALMRSHGCLSLPYDCMPRHGEDSARKEIDRRFWRAAFDLTGFMQVMDRRARQDFDRSLETNPPEFTLENVRMHFLSACQQADEFFARGLVEMFLRLSSHYKTNAEEPFKVGEKAILEWVCQPRWGGGVEIRYQASDTINDIDRVIQTLDGKKHHPRALESAINGKWAEGGNLFEDDYYRIRGFKKGTLHIQFKRLDLLEKANKIIHDYYHGSALARGRAA